jgi:hypothetical protein
MTAERASLGSWNEDDVEEFLVNLRQELLLEASGDEDGDLVASVFSEWAAETLAEFGEADDMDVAYIKARGYEAAGYALNEDEGRLDLLITNYVGSPTPATVPPAEVRAALARLRSFFTHGREGLYSQLEEASSAYDMALRLWEARGQIDRVRLFYVTDGKTSVGAVPDETIDGIGYTSHVWDLVRLQRASTSGRTREPISVRFSDLGFDPVPCIVAPHEGADYEAYLAIIPGQLLAEMYLRYGPRLLERNIRSFLQVRGKINAGIRQTIQREPHHFLAYNNGISVTASGVGIQGRAPHATSIDRIDDLQIVNGGQTTASLYAAWRRDKADLSGIAVAAKVTVVPPQLLDEFVPAISRYANSQNRINEADFAANDPFHVAIERYSRATWAPSKTGGQLQTKWFYERARGQYQDELAREETPARQRQFRLVYPPAQRFTKTDLAKFEHAWLQLPHVVSLGAEKNFKEFAIRLKERMGTTTVDQQFYQRVISKAILFKRTERIVSSFDFGGYRANIVAYTIALLSHRSAQRVDLDGIWTGQQTSDALDEAIGQLAVAVQRSITNPPGGRNVTEWCKKEQCWDRVRELDVSLPSSLTAELIGVGRGTSVAAVPVAQGLSPREEELVRRVAAVSSETWFALSNWAKQTSNLAGWQRSIAFSLGRYATTGRPPSVKQATQGERILAEARRLGFRVD